MKTKYDELTLTHNLSGVIITTERYEHIYKKWSYLIPPVIALYDDKIEKDATRTEVHRAEGKHEAKKNDRALYKTADTSCKNFIMEVVDETWYKEIEDPDTFYRNITSLKLLDHLTKFCSGLHTVDAVNVPQVIKTLFRNSDGIPKYINGMEAVQQKSKREKLVIHDEYMHALALKSLLQPGEYEMETREWTELLEDRQTWAVWKTTFREDYVAKRRAKAAWKGEEKPVGGSTIFRSAPENEPLRRREHQKTAGISPLTNKTMDSLEGYLNNIAAAAKQTAANG